MLERVRRKVLRRYYETMYGRGCSPGVEDAAYPDATWEEIFAIAHIGGPDVTPRRAAEMAWSRPDIRKLAPTLPDPPSPPEPDAPWAGTWIEKRSRADLRKAKSPAGSKALVLDRIAAVSGWSGLRGLGAAKVMGCLCDSPAAEKARPRARLDIVDLNECKSRFVQSLLASADMTELTIYAWGKESLDLSPLAGAKRPRRIWAHAKTVTGLGALAGLPLRALDVGRVEVDAELHAVLVGAGKTLTKLALQTNRPLAPDALPLDRLRALEQLEVIGHASQRAAWIKWAVAHPRIGCTFEPPPEDSQEPEVEVAEIYRDVPIHSLAQGKKRSYEVSGDLAEQIGYRESNGDLEDALRPTARAARKKISWSSESDTFVAQARDVATCRWLIDQIWKFKRRR
jgi:hypothetical protein